MNGWDHGIRTRAPEKFGLDYKEMHVGTFIDFFISSCFVHYRKPDADIYQIALDIAQVNPGQVVYIDDRAMFVEVAQGLGTQGILHIGLRKHTKSARDHGAFAGRLRIRYGDPNSSLSVVAAQ